MTGIFRPMRRGRVRKRLSAFTIVMLGVLAIYALSMLIPLLWGAMTALKSPAEFRQDNLGLPDGHIWQWQWGNFVTVLQNFIVRGITREQVPYEVYVEQMLL